MTLENDLFENQLAQEMAAMTEYERGARAAFTLSIAQFVATKRKLLEVIGNSPVSTSPEALGAIASRVATLTAVIADLKQFESDMLDEASE